MNNLYASMGQIYEIYNTDENLQSNKFKFIP